MKNGLPMHALKWLLAAVNPEEYPEITAYVKIRAVRNPYDFVLFRKHKLSSAKRIIILDGTGNKAESDRLFERNFTEVKAFVETKGKKIRIKKAFGKIKAFRSDDKVITELLEKAEKYIKDSENKKVLICTHKVITDRVKKLAENVFKHFEVIHFFGESRGVNLYEDYEAFIALGTPCVNAGELADTGNSLFETKQDFAKWLNHLNHAELFQACHRIRPAIYDNKTLVIIGRHYPNELGSPDLVEDLGRGIKTGRDTTEEAYQRCKLFVKRYGWLSRAMSYHLGISCKKEKTAINAFEWFKKWVKENNDNAFIKELQKFIPDEAILLGDTGNTYWNNFIERLKKDFPELPMFESNQGTGDRPAKGIGKIQSVYDFFKMLGIESKFEPDKWLEIKEKQPEP
jgi:hypothetical protein